MCWCSYYLVFFRDTGEILITTTDQKFKIKLKICKGVARCSWIAEISNLKCPTSTSIHIHINELQSKVFLASLSIYVTNQQPLRSGQKLEAAATSCSLKAQEGDEKEIQKLTDSLSCC